MLCWVVQLYPSHLLKAYNARDLCYWVLSCGGGVVQGFLFLFFFFFWKGRSRCFVFCACMYQACPQSYDQYLWNTSQSTCSLCLSVSLSVPPPPHPPTPPFPPSALSPPPFSLCLSVRESESVCVNVCVCVCVCVCVYVCVSRYVNKCLCCVVTMSGDAYNCVGFYCW